MRRMNPSNKPLLDNHGCCQQHEHRGGEVSKHNRAVVAAEEELGEGTGRKAARASSFCASQPIREACVRALAVCPHTEDTGEETCRVHREGGGEGSWGWERGSRRRESRRTRAPNRVPTQTHPTGCGSSAQTWPCCGWRWRRQRWPRRRRSRPCPCTGTVWPGGAIGSMSRRGEVWHSAARAHMESAPNLAVPRHETQRVEDGGVEALPRGLEGAGLGVSRVRRRWIRRRKGAQSRQGEVQVW